MKVSELLNEEVTPFNSKVLGVAVGKTLEWVEKEFNSLRTFDIYNHPDGAEMNFSMHAGSHIGVAAELKRQLKAAGLKDKFSYSKTNMRDTHDYVFSSDKLVVDKAEFLAGVKSTGADMSDVEFSDN